MRITRPTSLQYFDADCKSSSRAAASSLPCRIQTRRLNAVRLRTHYVFFKGEKRNSFALLSMPVRLLCRLTGTALRAALWVTARGKKGALTPQTPPSSPKPATWVRVIGNEKPHAIKISIYLAASYKNISIKAYCLIRNPAPSIIASPTACCPSSEIRQVACPPRRPERPWDALRHTLASDAQG